jgi:predicted DNA-binding ribbon-helix-helix protein
MSRLVNRNVLAGEKRTSMRLEPEMWDAIAEICAVEDISINILIGKATRGRDADRTSAVRVYILKYYRTLARRVLTEPTSDSASRALSFQRRPSDPESPSHCSEGSSPPD